MFENIIIVMYNSEFHVEKYIHYFVFLLLKEKQDDGIIGKIWSLVKRMINKKINGYRVVIKKKPV